MNMRNKVTTNKRQTKLLIGIFCLFSLLSHAQNTPFNNHLSQDSVTLKKMLSFVRDIATFNHLFPQEKVYLHFDNTAYYLGETMWFKAYVVNSTSNLPTHLSKVLHVELLSPEGRIMETQKLKIENGQCSGQFSLTHLIHAGFYEVRAYTRLMLNWDEEGMFTRVFPLYNYPRKESAKMFYEPPKMHLLSSTQALPSYRPKTKKNASINLKFFPESGHLVEGLTSNVAFLATDNAGNPLDSIEGTIYNDKDEWITNFRTLHNGMGKFQFTPKPGESYRSEISYQGKTRSFDIPEVSPQGYVMSLNALRKDRIYIQLSRSKEMTSNLPLGLCGMCRGKITFFSTVTWDENNRFLVDIARNELPAGVNQFAVFDSEGTIYLERMVFVNPDSQINFSCQASQETFTGKDYVSMEIQLTDEIQTPIETTFSIAVRDSETDAPAPKASNMVQNLLLESDIKGYIQDIDYYFEADDPIHRQALDLLLSTQGWSRYEWQQMKKPKEFIVKHPIEDGIMVVGQLRSTFRKRIKKNTEIKIWILSEDGTYRSQKGSCFTDSLGKFAFIAEDFEGRWKMFIHTKENDKRKEMRVDLDRNFTPPARAILPQEKRLFIPLNSYSTTDSTILVTTEEEKTKEIIGDKSRWENLLPTVDIKAKNMWESKDIMRWHNIIIDLNDERERMNDTGEDYLKSFYEWLEETNRYFSYSLDTIGKFGATYKNRPVLFATHRAGTPTWLSANGGVAIDIENLTMNDLDAIAISDKPGVSQALFTDTITDERSVVISLFVKEEYFTQEHDDRKGERKTFLKGYSPKKKFYMPDYSMTTLPDEKDYRRTLYWNPEVKTDTNGKARIEFYNTETCRKMKVSIATLTPNGLFGEWEQ